MSGFAAIVGPSDLPIDPGTIDAIAARLAWRGPDATSRWTAPGAAILHTLFVTTDQSLRERQPVGADHGVQLAGDVRLDARGELAAKLFDHRGADALERPDVELVLHAWLRWREDCLRHLRGDFAFVVWDAAARRLFAARDQFGVRPFFYAVLGDSLIVSNDLAALRAHAGVPDALDDLSITDMLAFGLTQDVAATAFRSIRRLRGGHSLAWQGGRAEVRRYWNGLEDRPIRFGRDEDYVDRYRELLSRAVSDRLRRPRAAVTLTGGLDSSSITQAACQIQASRGYSDSVHAHTIAYDRLIPDRERQFAELTARHLGLRTNVLPADDYQLYAGHRVGGAPSAEPIDQPFRAMLTDFYQNIARSDRVLLMGLDGDTFLCEVASDYLLGQLRRGAIAEYARGVGQYVRVWGRLPPHRIRSTARRLVRRAHPPPWAAAPSWLNPDIAHQFDVESRWRARYRAHDRLTPGCPLRPRARNVLGSPVWASMFEEHDAANLGALVEVRFPLTDLTLADFLMNIPAVPWCIDKHIVRRAMAGRLPREVVARPKTPLAGDPVRARLAAGDRLPWSADWSPHPELGRYVDVRAIARLVADLPQGIDVGVDTRALMLNDWLCYHLPRKHGNGTTADRTEAAQVAARA